MRTRFYQKTIVNSSTGSTVRHTSPSRIKECEVSVPEDEAEQKAIAKLLSSFDEKIELLQVQNETLETLAQAIFKKSIKSPVESEEVNLGELVEIKYGKDHKHLNEGSYPLYGSGGIMRSVESYS